MKAIAHAWLALMALERLKAPKKSKAFKKSFLGKNFDGYFLGNNFDECFREQAESFVNFFDKHKDAFVKGAWFPDSVISDNLTGGHTFKLKKPSNSKEEKESIFIKNRIPKHLSSLKDLGIGEKELEIKVFKNGKYTLPDRCEALAHSIRDEMLIQNYEPKGSDVMFNDDQITLYFLMLSHYLADAHVPPHCDSRDFYGPSKIHPDMESYWDKEIIKFYEFDKKRKVFDYDINGAPELTAGKEKEFKKSFLFRAIKKLSERKWKLKKIKGKLADKEILGNGNKKIYDYVKAICFASYLISIDFIPEKIKESDYKKIKILKNPKYKKKLDILSCCVIADAIDSIALVWLLTWEKYSKLEQQKKLKIRAIRKEGRIRKRVF